MNQAGENAHSGSWLPVLHFCLGTKGPFHGAMWLEMSHCVAGYQTRNMFLMYECRYLGILSPLHLRHCGLTSQSPLTESAVWISTYMSYKLIHIKTKIKFQHGGMFLGEVKMFDWTGSKVQSSFCNAIAVLYGQLKIDIKCSNLKIVYLKFLCVSYHLKYKKIQDWPLEPSSQFNVDILRNVYTIKITC